MSMFKHTMTKAITDYRQILRRYLSSQERLEKIKQLRLKETSIFKSELLLFQVGEAIIEDIQQNVQVPNEGYYSYHGITKFCQYLKQYLSNYETDGHAVIHKAQKAADAMIKTIQFFSMSDDLLDELVTRELFECSEIIANCGSEDQRRLFRNALTRQCEYAPGFYGEILNHYIAKENARSCEGSKDV